MSRFSSRRQHLLLVTIAAAAAALVATTVPGCARDHEKVEAAANAPIGIDPSNLFVTVTNKAGAPLTDLDVAIVTVTSQRFTKRLDRLEDGEHQDVSLADFAGADGTSFNLRFNTPKQVEVKATDVAGKKYDVSTRWQ